MSIRVIRSDVVYDGHLSRVRVDQVRFRDGNESAREVVEHLGAVAVVPLHEDGTVTLVRQYRHPVATEVLEVPAGICDVDGEAAETTARRELAEEAGLQADAMTWLTTMANSVGWTDETTAIFLATGLTASDAPDGFAAEAEEAAMAVERLPLAQALETVTAASPADAKTLVGLLLTERAQHGPAAHNR